jgi:hypothetical protein
MWGLSFVFSIMVMWKPPQTSLAALTVISAAPVEAFWNGLTQDEPEFSPDVSRNAATDIYRLTRVRFKHSGCALEKHTGGHPAFSKDHAATAIVLDIGFPLVNRILCEQYL